MIRYFNVGRLTMQPVFQYYRNGLATTGANDALPNYSDTPTCLGEVAYVSRVPFHILTELFAPELRPSCRGCRIATARVTMPETAMDKDNCSPSGQYNIRPSRKMASMKAEAQALRMERPSKRGFRLGVRSTYPSHHPGPRCGINNVSHGRNSV